MSLKLNVVLDYISIIFRKQWYKYKIFRFAIIFSVIFIGCGIEVQIYIVSVSLTYIKNSKTLSARDIINKISCEIMLNENSKMLMIRLNIL